MDWSGLIYLFSVVTEIILLVSLNNGVTVSNLERSGLSLMSLLRLSTGEYGFYNTVEVGLVFTSTSI